VSSSDHPSAGREWLGPPCIELGCTEPPWCAEALRCEAHANARVPNTAPREGTAEAPGRPADAPGPLPTTAGMVDQGGARLNAGKPPLHLAPLDGMVLVSWVGAFGSEKYAPRGWEQAAAEGRFSWSDCVRALLSHTLKLMAGQRDDSESGLPHVGHIAWNALALCSMLVRGNGLDDLPGPARGAPVPLEPGEWAPGEAFHRAVAEVRARKQRV